MNIQLLVLFVLIALGACSPRKPLIEKPLPALVPPSMPLNHQSTASTPIPDTTPAIASDCDAPIYVTEIFADPKRVLDRFGEFIELYNAGDKPVQLNGWRLSDLGSDSHVVTQSSPLTIAPRSFLVMGQSADTERNGGIEVDYVFHGFNLSNAGDRVRLEDPCGNLVFDISYPNAKGWPKIRAGRSVEQTSNPHEGRHSRWRLARNKLPGGDRATPGYAPWTKKH